MKSLMEILDRDWQTMLLFKFAASATSGEKERPGFFADCMLGLMKRLTRFGGFYPL
jgi:hypothetical protein